MTDSRAEFEAFVVSWTGRSMEYHKAAGTWGLGMDSLAWACWQASRRAAIEGLALTDAEIDAIKETIAGLAFICAIEDTGQLVDHVARAIIAALKEQAK